MNRFNLFLTPITLGLLASTAGAVYVPGSALVDPALGGSTQYDGWTGLHSGNYSGYGTFPGSGAWPTPIGSNRTAANAFNTTEAGDATLYKVANGSGGGPYLASGSIYFGGFSGDPNVLGGTLGVRDTTPVAGVKTVVFQLSIGEAATYDLYNHVLPVLSYNGGSQFLPATLSAVTDQFFNGTITMPTGEEPIYINTYQLTWDLSAIATPINQIDVTFTGVQHAQMYAARLDQSTLFTVPEPATLSLAAFGSALLVRRRPRR